MRIALIHALSHSVEPINRVMAEQWPDATVMNLLDDSLSADLARSGKGLDAVMHQRFMDLSDYVVGTGAQGILFTCSAFGPCIEAVQAKYSKLPIFKPNEAMIVQIERQAHDIGLIASFAGTLETMPREFSPETKVRTALAAEALEALNAGDVAAHDRLVLEAARGLQREGVGAIALAQFSMARAAPLLREHLQVPVFTTPDSAVKGLQAALGVKG